MTPIVLTAIPPFRTVVPPVIAAATWCERRSPEKLEQLAASSSTAATRRLGNSRVVIQQLAAGRMLLHGSCWRSPVRLRRCRRRRWRWWRRCSDAVVGERETSARRNGDVGGARRVHLVDERGGVAEHLVGDVRRHLCVVGDVNERDGERDLHLVGRLEQAAQQALARRRRDVRDGRDGDAVSAEGCAAEQARDAP